MDIGGAKMYVLPVNWSIDFGNKIVLPIENDKCFDKERQFSKKLSEPMYGVRSVLH